MWSEKYKDCLEYIDNYWQSVIRKSSLSSKNYTTERNPTTLILPYDYVTPNNKKFNYIFYWDTFFMFKGLIGTKYEKVMDKMMRNFSYLFEIYDIIPNFNALAGLGRSQPPFLSSMLLDTYIKNREGQGILKNLHKFFNPIDKKRLGKMFEFAKKEYQEVWIDKENAFNHHVNGYGLSRYGDRDIGYAHSSELESGWDFTSRFYSKCNYFLPIDLNVYLYKYEQDFAYISEVFHSQKEHHFWHDKASNRKDEINRLMWDEKNGFYFDYSWYHDKRSDFLSLAGFTPLWAGMADYSQAEMMLEKLDEFETESGLTITAKKSHTKTVDLSKIPTWYQPAVNEIIQPKQWDYPNIWPPLEYLTVIGLLKYGFKNEAVRIMKNSVNLHANLYRKYKTFFEKINSETKTPGNNFEYENQEGFGWTNAVFYRYIHILDALDSDKQIYKQSQNEKPPYELAIIH